MLDSTTPPTPLKCPNSRTRRHLVLTLTIAPCLLLIEKGDAASIIYQGGQPGVVHHRSDGGPLPNDGSIVFEIGTFYGGFEPTPENTEQWLDHWAAMTSPAGEPLSESSVPFGTISSELFGDFDGFSAAVELEHNNAPFTTGAPGFLWGFDNRGTPGDSQWILITNPNAWQFPDGGNPLALSQTWTVESAEGIEVVVGSIDGASMTMGAVTVGASPVPEPGVMLSTALGLLLLGGRRRRAPHSNNAS